MKTLCINVTELALSISLKVAVTADSLIRIPDVRDVIDVVRSDACNKLIREYSGTNICCIAELILDMVRKSRVKFSHLSVTWTHGQDAMTYEHSAE